MSTKHTPGPWKYHESKTERNVFFVTHEKMPVAKVSMSFTENESNARLVAAAPELLEALEEAARWIINDGEYKFEESRFLMKHELENMIKYTIAKAKGMQK